MEHQEYLEAAGLFRACQRMYQECKGLEKSFVLAFPVLQRQWDSIRHLETQIRDQALVSLRNLKVKVFCALLRKFKRI